MGEVAFTTVGAATGGVPGRRRPGQSGSLCGRLDASSEWISILDFDGRVLFVNEGGRRALERKNIPCLPGGDWAASWAGEWRSEAGKAVRAATVGQSSRLTARRLARDGAVSWWEIVLSPLPGAPGASCWVTAVAREVAGGPDNASVATAAAVGALPLATKLLDALQGALPGTS